MPDINVSYDEVESAARLLSSAREEFGDRLSKLKAAIDELGQSGFVTRVASRTFEDTYDEFNRGIGQTIEGLDAMSRFLTDTVERFREVDGGASV